MQTSHLAHFTHELQFLLMLSRIYILYINIKNKLITYDPVRKLTKKENKQKIKPWIKNESIRRK